MFSFKMPFFSFLQIYKPKVSGTAVRKLKGFPTDVVLENARSVLLDFQGNRGLKVMFMSNTRKLDISSVNNSEHSLSLSIMQPWFVLLCSSLINDLASWQCGLHIYLTIAFTVTLQCAKVPKHNWHTSSGDFTQIFFIHSLS